MTNEIFDRVIGGYLQGDAESKSGSEGQPDADREDGAGCEGELGASDADETTGASPGTAQACSDLGLNSLASNLKRFNIKPPGMS